MLWSSVPEAGFQTASNNAKWLQEMEIEDNEEEEVAVKTRINPMGGRLRSSE